MNLQENLSIHTKLLKYLGVKRFGYQNIFFDIIVSLLMLPILVFFIIVLFVINVIFKLGPVFYFQNRMGLNCNGFTAIKFRTMRSIDTIERKFNDPVEINRITWVGSILRKYRIDELPQIINVLKGDMSLIGPRPDFYDHAIVFMEKIDEYKWRYIIKPGISGLAQTRLGYAEGLDATRKKTFVDLYYIENIGLNLEAKILINTIIVVFKKKWGFRSIQFINYDIFFIY